MGAADPFDLQRFVTAQAPVFASALEELKEGRKRTHWMWFLFPQLRGLGSSSMATFYGIGSLEEALAYLAHPLLGPRLVLCTETVLAVKGKSLRKICRHDEAFADGCGWRIPVAVEVTVPSRTLV